MWPSFETASRLYDIANVALIASLIAGVISTACIVWMGDIKENYFSKDVSETQERSAALERDAAEARLETERIKQAVSWRFISGEKMALFTKRLSSHRSNAMVRYVRGDPEAQRFASQIYSAFQTAGWNVRVSAVAPLGAATGIWVLPNATPSSATSLAVSTASAAFDTIGLEYRNSSGPAMTVTGDTWGPHSPPVKIIVGSKPEPPITWTDAP